MMPPISPRPSSLGFEVTPVLDVDAAGFVKAIDLFMSAARGADVAVFYYAGHGLQYEGGAYLIPVDAKLESEFAIRRETVAAQEIVSALESTSRSLEEFIRRYPYSIYVPFAKARIEELKRTKSASGGDASSSWWPFGGRPEAEKPKETQTVINVPPKPVAPAPEAACDGLLVAVAMGQQPCIKPGSGVSFKDYPDCPEMVVVPEGSFVMGSPDNEPDRSKHEGPQHRVRIGKPFAVGRLAVTFAEWDACEAAGGCGGYIPQDQGWGRGDLPVINVSWNDAKAYVSWLAKKTGQPYRLLSEAEREYATRAGTTTPFWWGASITPEQAHYDVSAEAYNGGGSKGEYRQKTLPVKSFKPNPWGLYQVHGNVWEWVEDCWHDSYSGAPRDGSDWTSGECKSRVLRGGPWNYVPRVVRAACRDDGNPGFRNYNNGFRVARTLAP
jgi:formylglycine-generating enzyme required for sulfatase activity